MIGNVRRKDDADTFTALSSDRAHALVTQPSDPDKAGAALLALVTAENPSVRLFLGGDALGLVGQKLHSMQVESETWDALSRSTSFAA